MTAATHYEKIGVINAVASLDNGAEFAAIQARQHQNFDDAAFLTHTAAYDTHNSPALFSLANTEAEYGDAAFGYEQDALEKLPAHVHDYTSWNELETGADLHTGHVLLSIGNGVTSEVDPQKFAHITEPATESELKRAPDCAEWRLAQEQKMEAYKAIPVWTLIKRSDAKRHETIYRVKWVRSKKVVVAMTDGVASTTCSRKPRLCMIGTRMPRNIYNPFSDVMLMRTLKIFCAVGATYEMQGFTLDCTDAFQTCDDRSVEQGRPRILSYQAPGHEERGPNNEEMICALIKMLQGRIDSCNVFGEDRDKIFIGIPGVARCPFDPSTFVYHVGELAGTTASLTQISEKYIDNAADNIQAFKIGIQEIEIPASPPHGWAAFGSHVDDIPGIATSLAVVRYIAAHLAQKYAMKCVGWEHALTLGALIKHDRVRRTITLSADHLIDKMLAEHLQGEVCITPKHITTPAIMNLSDSDPQSVGPPDQDCKTRVQSLLGGMQWAGNWYPQVIMPTNRNGAFAANPTAQNERSLKYALMHLSANRKCVTFGGMGCVSLESDPSPPNNPYVDWVATDARYWRPHGWCDANLEHPRSTTSLYFMLAGAVIETIVSRQRATAKTVHDSETIACSELVARTKACRGILQAFSIHQIDPTPLYSDSDSKRCHVMKRSPRRSLYLMLRATFITDSFKDKETIVMHIDGKLNPATALCAEFLKVCDTCACSSRKVTAFPRGGGAKPRSCTLLLRALHAR